MRKRLKNTFIPHRGNGRVPHILSKKALLLTLGLVALIELSLLAGPALWSKVGFDPAAVLPSVVTLLTNDVRAENSLPGLTENELLTKAAQAKADDMAEKSYFAHVSPDGTQPWQWIMQAGYSYEYAGENLAVNFSDSREVVEAWQNSPTHNLNLLGPRYREIGVAVAEGVYKGREAVFVVQMFASPIPQVATSPTPTPSRPSSGQVGVGNAQQADEQGVLGVETAEAAESVSVAERVVSSPRTYSTYPLVALLLVLGAALLVGWGRHHPKAVVNGAVAMAVLVGVMLANEHVVFPELEVPQDGEYSANALHAIE